MIRPYTLRHHLNTATTMTIAFDAGPYGLGGILMFGATTVAFFSAALSVLDISRLGHQLGDAEGQQTWEVLAL